MKKTVGLLSVIIMLGMTAYSLFYSTPTDSDTKKTTATTYSFEKKTTAKKENAVQKALPDSKASDWNLTLVGPNNKIEEEVSEDKLTTLSDNSHQVDSRIAESYEAFSEAATKAGFPLVIISAFRSVDAQKEVFDTNVNSLISGDGLSEEDAIAKTKETITEPGYSEHHTGLAVDVVDQDRYNSYSTQVLDASYGDQPGAKWIAENAPKYGFIIRYPKDRQDITGITYEPWHIRYVGKENAEYITKHDLTLEEFLKQLSAK
ncbi:M15 family metallopeptidase [Enterococcus xiangfangensis]|uniref:M15 family metallopeptidase n=1 Tax=Enterococcus xiangfangensis TaxID=1296537 RepID=A0ABU3F9M9_9ENTE|nr:M15 family metallopeptidase [Enterococcus xiangfangensis]MDT2759353.1 M15 family metallopeptidase [Enterococcus xiangfangensis]